MFSETKIQPSKPISKVLRRISEVASTTRLGLLLKTNPFESMMPFNLWFRHADYKVMAIIQRNQKLRLRFYRDLCMTPTAGQGPNTLAHLNSCLDHMPLYQPFYPESFFSVWEFLQLKHISSDHNRFLNISSPSRHGAIEAIVLSNERHQQSYHNNTYHTWTVGCEIFDPDTLALVAREPSIDYLGQNYKIDSIEITSKLLKQYSMLSIDCIDMMTSISEWPNEEQDLLATLFYLINFLPRLASRGSLLLRLNAIGNDAWSIILELVSQCFAEYTVFRPTILNAFNPELFLFASRFDAVKFKQLYEDSIYYRTLRRLYPQRTFDLLYLRHDSDPTQQSTSSLLTEYQTVVQQWITRLKRTITDLANPSDSKTDTTSIDNWHREHELKQIRDLGLNADTVVPNLECKSTTTKLRIHSSSDNIVDQQFYRKLIAKKAELNYYKRVMDTKPSTAFGRSERRSQTEYLTWETLATSINPFMNGGSSLKRQLINRFGAEMVTNAWMKMYEIISTSPDLLPTTRVINSFHICEAPGAFVAALNHYTSNQTMNWYAQSLRSTNEQPSTTCPPTIACQALDDDYGLMSAHAHRWIYGDGTGDITRSQVIRAYASDPRLTGIEFMTGDGGLQGNPREFNEQEILMAKIFMGEVVCIMACLGVGKHAVLKAFLPMAEPLTISLIAILTQTFARVTITKPQTSHCTNSEVYILLRGFKGIARSVLERLYTLLDDPFVTHSTCLMGRFDSIFSTTYSKAVSTLNDRQIKALCEHYYYYYHPDQVRQLQTTHGRKIQAWFEANPVVALRRPLLH